MEGKPGSPPVSGVRGELLHLSYGRSALYLVVKEFVNGQIQGGVVPFKLRFTSSCMRARFNERDGQLYISGLKGWQTNAGKSGGLDRSHTGKPVHMPNGLNKKGWPVLHFTEKLDKELAEDPESRADGPAILSGPRIMALATRRPTR